MLVIIGKTPDFRSNFRNTVARNILDNKREKENNGMERKKKKDKKRENENGTMTIQIFQISACTIHTSTQSVRYLSSQLRVETLAIIRIVIDQNLSAWFFKLANNFLEGKILIIKLYILVINLYKEEEQIYLRLCILNNYYLKA